MATAESPQQYYIHPGAMTAAGAYAGRLAALPTDIAALCQVVQGLLLHRDWAPLYGVTLSEERKQEAQIRAVQERLARVLALDDRPLTVARPPERRLVGVCSHFAVLLCAMLRRRGVPARARCGFGAYFTRGSFEDHWVCEYWNAEQARWMLVDAQLDAAQRQVLQLPFDPLDVPRDRFIIAGTAWQWCHTGRADPQRFGIFDLRGLWFVRGNVLRDLAALNRMELLPWDAWGLMLNPQERPDPNVMTDEERALLDRVAALTIAGDEAFAEMRAAYEGDDRLRVPPVIRSYSERGVETVAIETATPPESAKLES